MTIQSMTGFARALAVVGPVSIVWEARSVNGKALDLRLRFPSGLDRLEPACRAAIQKRFARGSIQASLQLNRAETPSIALVVNERRLAEAVALSKRLEADFGLAPASVDGLLRLHGMLETPDNGPPTDDLADIGPAALALLDSVLGELATSRSAEGETLRVVLLSHMEAIERLVDRAEVDPSREPLAIKARLAENVALLMDAASILDEARLHMEAAFLATKSDIREELDRLRTHIGSARSLLQTGGAIGRKLDFLAQEFNRESNTLCAKSNAGSVTGIGLELKAVVDQFREQVQNLE